MHPMSFRTYRHTHASLYLPPAPPVARPAPPACCPRACRYKLSGAQPPEAFAEVFEELCQ